MFNRCTVAVILPVRWRRSLGRGRQQKSALYSGVGKKVTHHEVDAAAATLCKPRSSCRATFNMPGGIRRRSPPILRRARSRCSVPGRAFRPTSTTLVSPAGKLAPHGNMVKLGWRPIQSNVDMASEYVLAANHFPAG